VVVPSGSNDDGTPASTVVIGQLWTDAETLTVAKAGLARRVRLPHSEAAAIWLEPGPGSRAGMDPPRQFKQLRGDVPPPGTYPRTGESMLAHVGSASVAGVESHAVSVEVNISLGLPSFVVVGLPHSAVREGRERVIAALSHVGHRVPSKRITVNLAPADMPKEGSAFDLPIAVGVLVGMDA
jgi:hypothetical protein